MNNDLNTHRHHQKSKMYLLIRLLYFSRWKTEIFGNVTWKNRKKNEAIFNMLPSTKMYRKNYNFNHRSNQDWKTQIYIFTRRDRRVLMNPGNNDTVFETKSRATRCLRLIMTCFLLARTRNQFKIWSIELNTVMNKYQI